jgi:hypothetical protein
MVAILVLCYALRVSALSGRATCWFVGCIAKRIAGLISDRQIKNGDWICSLSDARCAVPSEKIQTPSSRY